MFHDNFFYDFLDCYLERFFIRPYAVPGIIAKSFLIAGKGE